MKFPREISVIVPENFVAVSNGELDLVDTQIKGKKKYVWEESNPTPSYLTSVVIGEFVETSKDETYDNRIPSGVISSQNIENRMQREPLRTLRR